MRPQNLERRLAVCLGVCLLIAVSGIKSEDAGCKKGCLQSENGLLQYVSGNVYEYSFDSIMTVGLSSTGPVAEADDTSLKIQGSAKLYAEGNCGYTLQLHGVKVTATKESAVEKKITQSIQKPVHFTMVSGKVEPEICADAADTSYALNIKRAVISLLQSHTDGVHEVDVFGQCATHSTVSKVGNAQVITKVRNLDSCAYREQINSGIVTGVVNEKSGVRSTTLLQADYSKESKLENGVIEHVQSVEEYKFVGTPKGSTGAPEVRAKVVTTLKVKNAAGAPAPAPATGSHGVSIIFQKPENYPSKNIAALKTALSELVQLTGDYVQKDSAKNFVELIRLMRNSDVDTLLELAAFPHPNKVLARKVYLDSLFRTGTAESIRAIIKQFNKLEDKEKVIALLSFNLAETVDKDTLNQAAALLAPTAPKEAYLAVGHLVSKYCQLHGCERAADVEVISKKFTDSLKHCKVNTKKDEERVVYVLKGIGNTRHLANSVSAALTECTAAGHSNRIRVAALQAFSAASCDPTLQKQALDLLRDHNEDSELRIEAYLAAIHCPNAELANHISEIVNNEPVYQVGGFIESNLRAIRDSTDATRERQRQYLGNVRVTKHFPKDYRRYSFNNEISYKFDALGTSASSDYKLIYSQHGFLPRAARLNVSTEVFGTNFNIFEANIRQENLENVLEYYLGPKGLLNKDFDEIMKTIEVGDAGGAGGRARRSVADDTAKFAKKYKTYASKNAGDINLDMSLKLFGSEMFFLSLGDNIPNTLDDIIRHFSVAFEEVKKDLSSFSKEFYMHTLFLDTDFIYPTGLGIPLELSAQGFAAQKIDFSVNVDLDSILEQNWQRSKYHVKFVPSADVNVNVQLGFNAYVLATGMRVASSLHTAAGADVSLTFINEGNGFNLDVELPREKIELIDLQVSTDFYVAEQDKAAKSIALKGAKKRKPSPNTEMCFNQLEVVGFTVCFTSSISDLSKLGGGGKSPAITEELHLSRPFTFNAYVTSERKFNLKGYHVPQTSAGNQQWKLDFSTPGSKESHDTSLAFELGTKPSTYGRISFDNPQYHLALEAGVNNDNKELVVYAQYEYNTEIKKNKIGFVKNGNEYKPVIEIQDKNGVTNSINGWRADGRVVVQKTGDKQTRYVFENFQVVNNENERVAINGWADVGPAAFNSELRFAPGQKSFFIKSNFQLGDGQYIAGFFVNDEQTPDNIMGGSARVKLADQELQVAVVAKGAGWEVDAKNELLYVKPEGTSAISASKFNTEVAIKNKNTLVGGLKLNGATEGHDKFNFAVELSQAKKMASLAVKYAGNQRAQNDYRVEANGKWNKHSVDLLLKCDVDGGHFIVDNVLSTSWGTALTVKGQLGQRYTLQDVLIDVQGTGQLSNKDKPAQWSLKVIGTPEKTNSEFKLSRDNAEVVKYNGELQHPQDKITAGKMNVSVKNMITAKADFKVAKNGKGEATAVMETQKTEPKHKIELSSKFQIQAPKYDIEATVVFDADKKLYIKTENTMEKQKVSTKNVVELNDKKFSFEANGAAKGEWRLNGELQGNFVLTTPDGRVVDGNFKRKMTTNAKTGVSQGSGEVQLNEQEPKGGRKRNINASAKIDKFNSKTKDIDMHVNSVYTAFDGKSQDISYHLKLLPKGQNRAIDFGVTVGGNLWATPANFAFIVDEYSKNHAVYRVNGKYGDVASANVNGNYNLGGRGVPVTYELQGNVKLPGTSFKTIEVKSHGKFIKPEAADTNGNYMAEFALDERTGNDQFVKFNMAWRGSRQQGAASVGVEATGMAGPLNMEGTYQREQTGSIEKGSASGKQKYAFNFSYADKYMKSAADMSYVGAEAASVHYTLDTSTESVKGIDVEVQAQKLEGDSYAIKVLAKHSGQQYLVDTKVFRGAHKKGFDVSMTLPNEQPIIVVGVFEVVGDHKAKLTVEVANLLELDLKANAEASYKDVSDFYVVAQWNSAKLKLDNYDLDVRSQGKAIAMQLKNAQGVVFAGSATYALKREKNKAIIEGQGQLQYKGKSQNTNFRLIRQIYDIGTDNEIGFSYTFNGNFGPKNGVSTLKITNKDFNVKLSVCEEKKQCTNVQLQSIVTADEKELDSLQHSLLVLIDLRELGYPYEFELQSKTIRQGFKLQYSLDSNLVSNNNLKYQLIAHVLPTNSKVQIKLPTREILFETQQQFPTQGQLFGHYENSAAFYFDKANNPNDVTRLVATADITGIENVALNAKGAIRFEHPTIRPLVVSGKFDANRQTHISDTELILDIFRTPEQKVVVSSQMKNTDTGHGFNITSNQSLRSVGLGLQYEFNGHTALNTDREEFSAGVDVHSGSSDAKVSAYVFGNKERFEVSVYALNEPVVQFTGEFNRQKLSSKFNSRLQVFEQQPVEFTGEAQPSAAKFAVKRQGLIDANGEIKLTKEIKFNVVGSGKQLLNGRVALDATNFLQTTYESSDEDIKTYMQTVETEITKETDAATDKIKKRFQKLRQTIDEQIQLAKDSTPDFSKLTTNYQNNMNQIVKELENDPALKHLAETYNKLYTKFAKIAGDIAKIATEAYEKLHKSFVALYEKLQIILKDTILPAWEQFMLAATKIVGELRIELVNLYTHTVHAAMTVLDQYGPALKSYGRAINSTLQPVYEALNDLITVASQAAEEFANDIREHLAKLPTFDALCAEFKEKLDQLKLVERVLEIINNVFDQLHILPQTPETVEFLQKAQEFIVAQLKQQPVDTQHLIEELFKLFVRAVRSVWAGLDLGSPLSWSTGFSTGSLTSLFSSLPYSVDIVSNVPGLLSLRVSLINFLLNENWDHIFSLNHFKSWIFFHDFELQGHVADGRHIFTFDGRYHSLPGSCKYILAQDSVDNNFTVIAQLNNGKFKAIILTDRDGNFLEVNDVGALKMNGNAAEFPQHLAGMHAWRKYYTVYLFTDYGVEVMCTSDLKVCHITVNGFYTSKTRGLLGNGNAEPSDDFTLTDGTVGSDAAAVGNSYALGKCAAVAAEPVDANRPHADICNELFSVDSPLMLGYLFVNANPYREACDAAVNAAAEKDKEAAACNIALAYGSALTRQRYMVTLPERCLKCAGAAGQRDLGQEFQVKVPNNKADVVFVVDIGATPVVLSNLVAPAITEVRETLKARGFTDVQIGVVAYNESERYPAVLTSDNGKLNYQGNVAEVQLNGPKNFCENCIKQVVNDKKVLEIYELIERLVKAVIPQADELAFHQALDYPFRAGAAKSIVAVRSNTLEYGNLLKYVRAQATGAVTKFDSALLHLIGPVNGMSLEGVAPEKLVGFNARLVATVDGKDAKKRQKLQFTNDMGIDFVLDNGGWVFATQNFDKMKAQDQKKALNQVTNSIADTLFKTEIVSDCSCVTVHGLHAQHKCAIKSSNFVPNKKVKAA